MDISKLKAHHNLVNLWATLVAEELVRLGVKLVCIAPGSRSTPLVAACAKHPKLEKIVCQDERSIAFCALGFARASGSPAAVITTSGSAVANLLPAVVEASNDHVPILLLTADRPPELRGVGANQTIDQTKIFGAYARYFVDMPVPDEHVSLRFLLSTLDEAHRKCVSLSGPVHLNFMFREPFDLDAEERWSQELLKPLSRWCENKAPLTSRLSVDDLAHMMEHAESGIIVAGAIRDEEADKAVLELAEKTQWPLLPDVLSNLRLCNSPVVANFVDLALLDHTLQQDPPQFVLQFGGRLVSKRLQQYLDAGRSRTHVLIESHHQRLDPGCVLTHRVEGRVAHVAESLREKLVAREPLLSPQWIRASQMVGEALLAEEVDASLSEISVARSVVASLSKEQFLFCASSMPIRDINMFAARHANPPRIYANRGASGIDGIISTACGVSRALGRPGVLLSGDLTFLYDTNGLALLKALVAPLTIVVVNNRGGGIFTMLDVHRQREIFSPYFDAEHDTDLSGLCRAYQIPFERVTNLEQWRQVASTLSTSTRVIEVMSDKWDNKALHDRIREQIRARF